MSALETVQKLIAEHEVMVRKNDGTTSNDNAVVIMSAISTPHRLHVSIFF
jgi:hypothetical protein